MSIQIKLQVLAITPMEERSYEGRISHSRAFQCFAEGKVAVHTLYAPHGDKDAEIAARKKLEEMQAGYYMADIELRQGARAKMEWAVANFTPIVQQPKATV